MTKQSLQGARRGGAQERADRSGSEAGGPPGAVDSQGSVRTGRAAPRHPGQRPPGAAVRLGVCIVALAGCGGPTPQIAAAPPQAATAPAAPAALTPAQIAARATPAVVTIRGRASLGTGFLV